jgi:glycolate oxidase iron-sulfur subunit
MHTQPAAELADTALGHDAKQLLRSCVHCGFCLPACPTYRVAGNELDSPRGRIYLIKQLVEGGPASELTRNHLDRCLTCRSCESACPSGVEYGRIVDLGRELIDRRVPRPAGSRLIRGTLAAVLSRRSVFTPLLRLGQLSRPLLPQRLRAMIPERLPVRAPVVRHHSRRVVMLEGCVQPGLAPQINAAATRLLDRLGIEVQTARNETCCGALPHHLGYAQRAHALARRNVDACLSLLDAGAEAVVSTASGCGVQVKDYGHLLRDDPAYADKARRVAAATRDLSELIDPAALRSIMPATATTADAAILIAWQAPCSLQHGQRNATAGRVESLLRAAGFRLAHVSDPHLCCGSAGTYSLLQPAMSHTLRERKLGTLQRDRPTAIATANIGCLEHLRAASEVPVRHWVELVMEALGRTDATHQLGSQGPSTQTASS